MWSLVLDKKTKKSCGGFTLVEMAVVIVIVGLALAAGSQLYTQYLKDRAALRSSDNLSLVASAIGSFRSMYGRYPCPASLTDPRDALTYGHEAADFCATTAQAVGTCAAGLCIEESVRDVDPDPAVTDRPRVRVGWIPFRELGLPESIAFDGYDNRIMYAVTERLADATLFNPVQGGIDIVNDTGATILDTEPGSAHFLIIAPGRSNAGAFSRAGVQLPCPAAGSAERENTVCTIAPATAQAVYRAGSANDSQTAAQFDDTMTYFVMNEMPLWQHSVDPAHPGDIHQKPAGDVGVNIATSDDVQYRMSVVGIMRAEDDPDTAAAEGRLMADELCDSDGATDCFASSVIAGDFAAGTGGIECPAGQVMVGISHNAADCRAAAAVRCPDDKAVIGVAADGTLQCSADPVFCPVQSVDDCEGKDIGLTLPSRPSGATETIASGLSRIDTYKCVKGAWQYQGGTGNCNCTPKPSKTVSGSCGTGFSGTKVTTFVWDCSNGFGQWVVGSTDTSACVCQPTQYTRKWSCPSNYTGSRTMQWTVTCPGPVTTGPVEINNTCECKSKTETRTLSCAAGFSGSIKQERTLQCPSGKWSSWTTTDDSCTCKTKTETWKDYTACAAGYTGHFEYERTFQCPSATWSAPVVTKKDCKPVPPQICNWQPKGSGSSSAYRTSSNTAFKSCTCGSGVSSCSEPSGSYYMNYAACECK